MIAKTAQDTSLKELAQAAVTLVRDPDADKWRKLTDLLQEAGCHAEALDLARVGLMRFPQEAPLALTAARLLVEAKDPAGAVDALELCLKQDPPDPEALWLSADLHHRLGHPAQARTCLERLLDVQPEHEAARDLLATLKVKTPTPGSGQTAKRSITTPTLAEIYVKQGYLSKAIQVYQEILLDDPENVLAKERLSELQAATVPPVVDTSLQAKSQQVVADISPAIPAENLKDAGISVSTEPASLAAKAPAVETPSMEQRLLGVFDNWLTAISKRRAHVR